MIRADRGFLRDWCHNLSDAVTDLSGTLAGNGADLLRVEDLAYQFAQLVVSNLSKVNIEAPTSAELIYYASMGLIRGAADCLAALDAETIVNPPEIRTN